MHHLYPAVKGDPLCPLGFHPQVRWPTRCKRCFRDYKEHGNRAKEPEPVLRRDDSTASSPSLSTWNSSSSRSRDDSRSSTDSGLGSRSWGSGGSTSGSEETSRHGSSSSGVTSSRFGSGRPASWTSTPDLGNLNDDTKAEFTTVSFTLPRRRPQPNDTGQSSSFSDTFTSRRRSTNLESTNNSSPSSTNNSSTSSKSTQDKPPDKTRQRTSSTPMSTPSSREQEKEKDLATTKLRRVRIQSLKEVPSVEESTNPEVEFIIQVKSSKSNQLAAAKTTSSNSVKKPTTNTSSSGSSSSGSGTSSEESYEDDSDDDATSLAGTETTETTLIDRNENELQEQIDSLKQELEMMRTRCERVEREKSDILLRRIAAIDMAPSKTAASEVLKLQQRVNELQGQLEDFQDDKKSLVLRVKELEDEIETRPDKNTTQKTTDELRSKLLAAETLCEELMDENEDMKKELRDLEEEIEEMQDNFREDQADEYSSLKKELEQTAKNCRILSFKLRKAERKTEQLEAEKAAAEKKCKVMAGGQTGLDKAEKIRHLEQELGLANEVAIRLQKELDETNAKLKAKEEASTKEETKQGKKKAPMLGSIGKIPSGEKVSRESLTRGGSQDDPVQLLRDLQDAMEREADLREQLRFAEEEAQTLRKKSSRVEDDNESLVLQLKKMATKARSRRHSPSPARLTPEPSNEKDEGISDEEDPAELRLLLELNEQEAAVLRRKVEELEKEGESMKKKVKELQDKLSVKSTRKNTVAALGVTEPGKGNALYEQKMKLLDEEVSELRKKLIEKDRDCERLHAELSVTQKRVSKGSIQKSKSLDGGNEQQNLDLKRQLQVIEQEVGILRTQTQTLESENEKLSAENKRLQLLRGAKKTTPTTANGEVDISTELKEKITTLENQLTEANQKVSELQRKLEVQDESAELKKKTVKDPEVAKLKKDIKSKTEDLEKMKTERTKSESENVKLNQALKRLKDDAISSATKFYKQRTPKKPTDLTTKLQMKKMVEELETEIGELLVVLKKSEIEKNKLKDEVNTVKLPGDEDSVKEAKEMEKDLENTKKKLEEVEKELKDEKEKAEKDRKKAAKEKKSSEDDKNKSEDGKQKLEQEKKTWEEQKKKLEEAKKKVEAENKKIQGEKDKLQNEKKKLEEDINKLNLEKVAANVKQDEVTVFIQRIESLKKELEDEKYQGVELRQQLELSQRAEQEKTRLQKEVAEKTAKITETDKKSKEMEDKLKKTERLLTSNKNKATKLEKELEEERERSRSSEATQQGVAASWLAERDSLKKQLVTLQSQTDSLEVTLVGKAALIEQLEVTVKEERERATDASVKAGSAEKRELNSLRDDLTASKGQVQELTQKLEKSEKNLKSNDEKMKKVETDLKRERDDMESKASELEMDLQAERKKSERMKVSQDKELKNRDQELASLRTKLRSLESNSGATNKKLSELRQEYQNKIDKLEEELTGERHEYEDLTAKYEILEEEHVVTKAQLVMEKEAVQGQLLSTKRDLVGTETELRTLRETYNTKQDAWIKEKLDQQERLKELEEKVSRSNGNDSWNMERSRLKASNEEKIIEMEQLKKEIKVFSDQMDHLRKENDELRHKLDDYNKVAKIQRNITADTSAIDRELKETRNKLYQEEKHHKGEIAQMKLRYDSRVALIGDEIQALQAQVSRFKRERDTFRHMLEGAQKTIGDLKAAPSKENRTPVSSGDESEETRTKIASLDQQISCMEDELSEARLEGSKLKTELISERSSWEVKIAEMQSRVNELEEERILTSGRTKIPGMRTRMELAWQKEREEQHRLLQETSTLARDLRQTLFEVERERDKERLEAKRRHDLLKKTTEEEQEENRKKVTELQCDLLELRDAHAKLRTTNEKLRREKERNEKEREGMRQLVSGRKRAEQDEERKVNSLLEQVDELMRLAPDLFPQKQRTDTSDTGVTTPTPPRRLKGPKSRESSPSLERKEFSKESSVDRKIQLQTTVQRLSEVTEELRRYQRQGEEDRDRDRAKRTIGLRRAASTESENPPDSSLRSKAIGAHGVQKKGSLYRKSLSLEQTSAQEQQSIWKTDDENDGSMSSLQSFESGTEPLDSRFYTLQRRETSMDSRLSGGSTQSEVTSNEKKKKKGILGKLKKLTKSRSIDDSGPDYSVSASTQGSALGGSGSDISIGDEKGSKKDLRDRLTGMFKMGSRSNSLERGKSPALPDSQRLLTRNGSSSTLPRPSPARSDTSQTSSVSRPLAPGIRRTTNVPSTATSTPLQRKTK